MRKWKGSFAAAAEKGRQAALEGKPRTPPYPERAGTNKSGVTFSRAFRKAWLQGYDNEAQKLHTDHGE